MKKQENPAKIFLRRYLSLCSRAEAIQNAIDAAMSRAFATGVTLKQIKVLSSPAEHDPMARDVCNAVDACDILYREKAEAGVALREILNVVDSLKDERQKEVITRRYINGDQFTEICEAMHYEKTQVFVIHGRALIEVNKYLQTRQMAM